MSMSVLDPIPQKPWAAAVGKPWLRWRLEVGWSEFTKPETNSRSNVNLPKPTFSWVPIVNPNTDFIRTLHNVGFGGLR